MDITIVYKYIVILHLPTQIISGHNHQLKTKIQIKSNFSCTRINYS